MYPSDDWTKLKSRQPLAERRGFLTLGLATVLASCAPNILSKVDLPTWNNVRTGKDVLFSGPDYERVRKVGDRILTKPIRGPDWQYGVSQNQSISSLAFFGNGITISKGLLTLCENDGQVGAILFQASSRPMARELTMASWQQLQDASSAIDADVATIRTLARAGYDPRDALVIEQRITRLEGDMPETQAPRWIAMARELRKLGYQV